jgi:hypothetical protein
MRHLLLTGLLIFSCGAGWGQGSSGGSGQSPIPGSGGGVTPTVPGNSGVAIPESTFKAQCISSLLGHANEKLHTQLVKDKAVTQQVLGAAKLDEAQLGANCQKVCGDFAQVSHKISWAHVSPGFLSEPEHTLQKVFGAMPKPPLPGAAALEACLPQQATMNWCPPSGSGVGAGPSRIENPLDKIRVCVTATEALQQMNFTAADAAHNCARPAIVDAAERVKAEHACVADAAKADAKAAEDKAAAAKAAANGVAQLPVGLLGVSPGLRKKP